MFLGSPQGLGSEKTNPIFYPGRAAVLLLLRPKCEKLTGLHTFLLYLLTLTLICCFVLTPIWPFREQQLRATFRKCTTLACVSQRDGGRFARHDTLDSDAGQCAEGQGRSSGRSVLCVLVACFLRSYYNVLFSRRSFFNFRAALSVFSYSLKRFTFDYNITIVNTRINHVSCSAARLSFLLGGDYQFHSAQNMATNVPQRHDVGLR
jgi:hypothetical protein